MARERGSEETDFVNNNLRGTHRPSSQLSGHKGAGRREGKKSRLFGKNPVSKVTTFTAAREKARGAFPEPDVALRKLISERVEEAKSRPEIGGCFPAKGHTLLTLDRQGEVGTEPKNAHHSYSSLLYISDGRESRRGGAAPEGPHSK